MSAGVLSIVPKKIGEGGLKSGSSVKRLQQLLWMAGYTSVGTADGGWGKKTAAAWAAFQETASYRSQPFVYAVFDTKVPLALNCTSFAQSALSLWHYGNLHNPKYQADQMVGAFVNLSQSRYGYQALPGTEKPPAGVTKFPGLYSSLEELQAQLKAGTLYHFALCKSNGSITHDTVLYDGEVYESNKGGPVTVRKTALAERWEKARNASRYAIVSKPL